MMRYGIGESGQVVEFSPSVLGRLDLHRQHRFWQCEAGGQLFGRFIEGTIIVGAATGPRPTDLRTPFSYIPDKTAEKREIAEMRDADWHYVGDWHTHPQAVPKPSGRDIRTVRSTAQKSRLVLSGVLMVIVGRQPFPAGLYVGAGDRDGLYQLPVEW